MNVSSTQNKKLEWKTRQTKIIKIIQTKPQDSNKVKNNSIEETEIKKRTSLI